MIEINGCRIKMGRPESFGWVRFPEKDDDLSISYERPSGALVRIPRGISFIVVQRGDERPWVKAMRQANQAGL